MKDFFLDYDKDCDYIYLVDRNYGGSGLNRDMICIEYIGDKKSPFKLYQVCRMPRSLNDGLLKIIGVDLE